MVGVPDNVGASVGVAGTVLGSVADKVARAATCPVLILKGAE